MKKKLLLIVSLCLCLLGLTACDKTDPTTVDYNGYTYDQLKEELQNSVSVLTSMSEEEKAYYLANVQEWTVNLINRWDEATEGVGAFIGFGEFSISQSGKTLTTEQEVVFNEKSVTVTFVYKNSSMEIEDASVEQIRSMSERMTDAVLNTIIGMGSVFVILILISLLIYAFRVIPYLTERNKKAPETVIQTDKFVEQITQREQQQDDKELVAVIAAAIAAAAGTSTDEFVVRSIKRR